MSDAEKFELELTEELAKIILELEDIAVNNPESDDWVAIPMTEGKTTADNNAVADFTEDWNERRATLSHLETRYRNLKRALKKIQSGTYGICEISQEPIETDRLEANPAARTNLANIDRESELPL